MAPLDFSKNFQYNKNTKFKMDLQESDNDMELHLTHALVLTPFESSLSPREWSLLAAEDYPLHALYCHESRTLLFYSDNQKSDCAEEISKIIKVLVDCQISCTLQQQIIVMREDENCYEAQDVLKHLNV